MTWSGRSGSIVKPAHETFYGGTGKRRKLGTFSTRAAAEKHERAVQYFKRH
jgi:hypothetical protein